MRRSAAAALGLGAIAFGALGIYVARHLEVTTRVTQFLSESDDLELASVSKQIAESAITRTLILSIEAPDVDTAVEAATAWEPVLSANPEVARVRSGPGDDFAEAVHALYFPRRHYFMSDRPEAELASRLSESGLRQAARDLRNALALPEGALLARLAGSDPLQAFPGVLRRLEAARMGSLRIVRGHFAAAGEPVAILFVTTVHSPFDASHQTPFAEFIERSFAEFDARFGGALRLERSGVHRFAVASERSARADMTRISLISISGIVLLFLLVFRSPRLFAISLLPLCAGVLVATAVGIALFGPIHAITLAFGATLIGVCIDYPIHYLNHHTLLPDPAGPWGTLRRVGPSIAMGAFTSVAGFAGLAWSDFPGVREIGVFAGVGILAALAASASLLPPLAPVSPRASATQRRLADGLAALFARARRRPARLAILPGVALLVCLAALPGLHWEDDVFALNMPLEPSWLDEDHRVRERVSHMDTGRFVVALGPDAETALRRNDAVHERLLAEVEAGHLERFRSLHAFLWSAELQERNAAALGDRDALAARTLAALGAEGFRTEAFADFARSLQARPPPLTLEDLLDSPLADAVAPFHVALEQGPALLTFVRGVSDVDALEASLADLEGVHFFDQQRFLANLYARYRGRTMVLIGAGLAAVMALLLLRYRRIGWALAAGAPALLAAGATLALVSLTGSAINLLHLLGLLLVLSFGVDYSIFLLETRRHADETATTLLSIATACATTVLAFGLLAMSSYPALRALGVTTGLGALLSLILAPTALILAGASPGDSEPADEGR